MNQDVSKSRKGFGRQVRQEERITSEKLGKKFFSIRVCRYKRNSVNIYDLECVRKGNYFGGHSVCWAYVEMSKKFQNSKMPNKDEVAGDIIKQG